MSVYDDDNDDLPSATNPDHPTTTVVSDAMHSAYSNMRRQGLLEFEEYQDVPPAAFDTKSQFDSTQDNDITPIQHSVRFADDPDVTEQQEAQETLNILVIQQHSNNRIGCASYDAEDQVLTVMALDMEDTKPYFLTQSLMSRYEGYKVLVNARADEDFVEVINQNHTPRQTAGTRPSNEFQYDSALKKVSDIIDFQGVGVQYNAMASDEPSRRMKQRTVESLLGTDNLLSVGCAGSLITYLHSSRTDSQDMQINGVTRFMPADIMYVSRPTLLSLDVFKTDTHPNMHMGRNDEGLSLFNLMNRTQTYQGHQHLRRFFLQPTTDQQVLEQRYNVLEWLCDSNKNHDAVMKIKSALKNIPNVGKMVYQLSRNPTVRLWQMLYKLAFYAVQISRTLSTSADLNLPMFQCTISTINIQTLTDLGTAINFTVDFEASRDEGRTVVKFGVDTDLDDLKHFYNGLPDLLSQLSRNIGADMPTHIASVMSVLYFPQLGFLMMVPKEIDLSIELVDAELMFSSDLGAYYKTDEMRHLDDKIGDIHGSIVDKEIDVLFDLQRQCLAHVKLFLEVGLVLGEMDCMLSMSEAALDLNLVRPMLNQDKKTEIVAGWHPLLVAAGNTTVIPNDTLISKEHPFLLLTGPNFSGKSVYLKQIAVITYMAQIGSFVPAKSAEISITDRLFTRIACTESLTLNQSAYMTDLQQVLAAVRNATPSSLVILDEFGKGTASTDGIGMFYAVIKSWLDKGIECPNVVCCTHFYELITMRLLDKQWPIMYLQMEILLKRASQGNSNADPDELVYLYRVTKGSQEQALGTFVAMRAGIPKRIVDRSKVLSSAFADFSGSSSAHAKLPLLERELQLTQRRKFYRSEKLLGAFLSTSNPLDADQLKQLATNTAK